MHVAMWSGPRNLSTAMMYSFAQRADFAVVDEPFYAAYLQRTGLQHPMREQVIAAGEVDVGKVIARCTDDLPEGRHLYQKHMTQHMVPGIDLGWLREVTNVFLIRHPARVIASFAAKMENPTLEDIGFGQQADLYDLVTGSGQAPIVVDSADIRADPKGALTRLCHGIGVDFDPAMLSWPKGGNAADGVWAAHWYGAVHGSTGFAGPETPLPQLSGHYAKLMEATMPIYRRLQTAAREFSAR